MSKLHTKWSLYESDKCPFCQTEKETNKHLWSCNHCKREINHIIQDLRTSYKIDTHIVTNEEIILAMCGIVTQKLSTHIKSFIVNNADEDMTFEKIQVDMKKHLINFIQLGKEQIWHTQNTAAIDKQKQTGISKRDKKPGASTFIQSETPDGILTHITQTIAIASPRVYIDDEKLNKQCYNF